MATVIVTEENPNYRSTYPSKHTKLCDLVSQDQIFVTAQIDEVRKVSKNQSDQREENKKKEYEIYLAVLKDETGTSEVLLSNVSPFDTQSEAEAKKKTKEFFENNVGKTVHILNARVKAIRKKNEPDYSYIQIDKWSQLRIVFNQEIIEGIQNRIDNPQTRKKTNPNRTKQSAVSNEDKAPKEKAEKPKKEPKKEKVMEYTSLWEITPNVTRSINVKAKVVDVSQFKRLKGFLPDLSTHQNEQGEAESPQPDSLLATLADESGKIYGVFPNVPKFDMIQKGSILSFMRARIDRFDGDVKGESQIYLTIFLKDEKNSKYRGEIITHDPQTEVALNGLPLLNGTEQKDPKNVSKKVWIIETPQQ